MAEELTESDIKWLAERTRANKFYMAILKHHDQKADDRCILDDDELYAAAGLPPCDRCVGDQEAMLHNCKRFIAQRTEPGKWPTYVELENRIKQLEVELATFKQLQ